MNKKFKVEVWIEEEQKYYEPTLYTIDTANELISFNWMSKFYQVPLDEVHICKK